MKKLLLVLTSLMLTSVLWSQIINNEDYELFANNGADNDYYGTTVSIYEDYAAVGSPNYDDSINGTNCGTVYVYRFYGGQWTLDAQLLAFDGNAGDEFGRQIEIYKDMVVVGAHNHTHNDLYQAGAVYVYKRNALGGWSVQKFTAPDAAASDHYGRAVSFDGMFMVVGALDKDTYGTNSGTAYVYKFASGTWYYDGQLFGTTIGAGDNFGQSVSVSGNYIAIGAMYDDDNGSNAGAAYVFYKNTTWSQQAKLLASDGAPNDWFSNAISIDGDYIAVAASEEDEAAYNAGAAYVFHRSGTTWTQFDKLVSTIASSSDGFGSCIDISEDYIVVGSRLNNTNGTDAGIGYIYQIDELNSECDLLCYLQPEYVAAGDGFGRGVSISPYHIMGGSFYDDNSNGTNAGAAYIFSFPSKNSGSLPSSVFQENLDDDVSIYPNPSQHGILVESSKTIDRITIYNCIGEQILTFPSEKTSEYIEIDQLKSGIYFIDIISTNEVYRKKFIKE